MASGAYNLVDSYVLGFALQEVNLPFSNAEELAAMGEELLAYVRRTSTRTRRGSPVSSSRPGSNYGNEFEFGLDLILDGIERALQGA